MKRCLLFLLHNAGCLSVRPSVTHRYYVEMAKHIIKPFHNRTDTTLLFHTKHYGNIPMRTFLVGHRMHSTISLYLS